MMMDYDWREVVKFGKEATWVMSGKAAPFEEKDVDRIEGQSAGENDGMEWVMWGELKDGRWFSVYAWCDYTGWDCQSGGEARVANSEQEIWIFGLTEAHRERLGGASERGQQ